MWIISTSIFIILITYNVYLNSLNNRLYMTVFIIIYALELDNSLSNYTSQMLWQLSGYRIVMISCQRVLFPTDAKFFQLTLTIFFSEWSYFNTPPPPPKVYCGDLVFRGLCVRCTYQRCIPRSSFRGPAAILGDDVTDKQTLLLVGSCRIPQC